MRRHERAAMVVLAFLVLLCDFSQNVPGVALGHAAPAHRAAPPEDAHLDAMADMGNVLSDSDTDEHAHPPNEHHGDDFHHPLHPVYHTSPDEEALHHLHMQHTHQAHHTGDPVSLVLIGATGNLARKYLWQALFDIWMASLPGSPLKIYGGARTPTADAWDTLRDIFANDVSCHRPAAESGMVEGMDCQDLKHMFLSRIQYAQLKSPEDYASLHELIEAGSHNEAGRLFYLSVVPKAYATIAALINRHARPSCPHAWTRVVIEKPIGDSAESADRLLESLASSFGQDELLFVDHYLGKAALSLIPDVRVADPIGVERSKALPVAVDVVMTETETVEGRTWFYEPVGVLRDVMQNHMSQMVAHAVGEVTLLSAGSSARTDVATVGSDGETTTSSSSLARVLPTSRVDLLRRMKLADAERGCGLEGGQYASYSKHAAADRDAETWDTNTPTAARVPVALSLGKAGAPVTDVTFRAGKALPRREAFVHVNYGDDVSITYVLHGSLPIHPDQRVSCVPQETMCAMFTSSHSASGAQSENDVTGSWIELDREAGRHVPVHDLRLAGPAVIVSGPSIDPSTFPHGWTVYANQELGLVIGTPPAPSAEPIPSPDNRWHFGPAVFTPGGAAAYATLFTASVNNDVSRFVTAEEVRALWGVWSPIVDEIEALHEQVEVRQHEQGDAAWMYCE